jgi:hypothetical protein
MMMMINIYINNDDDNNDEGGVDGEDDYDRSLMIIMMIWRYDGDIMWLW